MLNSKHSGDNIQLCGLAVWSCWLQHSLFSWLFIRHRMIICPLKHKDNKTVEQDFINLRKNDF